jgi:hypothetical protein
MNNSCHDVPVTVLVAAPRPFPRAEARSDFRLQGNCSSVQTRFPPSASPLAEQSMLSIWQPAQVFRHISQDALWEQE